ncbi:17328_t:CDS:1, partial [Racocetra persica]
GIEVDVNQSFSDKFYLCEPDQDNASVKLFYTPKYSAQYCDETEMKSLGEINIDLPDTHLGLDKPVLVTLCFGKMEVVATVKNETNGDTYTNSFKLEL